MGRYLFTLVALAVALSGCGSNPAASGSPGQMALKTFSLPDGAKMDMV